jgi:hypothetical protein
MLANANFTVIWLNLSGNKAKLDAICNTIIEIRFFNYIAPPFHSLPILRGNTNKPSSFFQWGAPA